MTLKPIKPFDFDAAILFSDILVEPFALGQIVRCMFSEDGRLHVYGVGEDGVTAFTEYGIECLRAPANPADEIASLRCSPDAF